MNVEIINKRLELDVYGFSGTAIAKDYAGTAFKLMDKMWQAVKSNNLSNKGLNIWIYEPNEKVFAGVELDGSPDQNIGPVSYTHLRAHETVLDLVCRLLLEKKK